MIALLVRTTGFLRWDVWLIIPVDKDDYKARRGNHDPSYGRFQAKRSMQKYFINDITEYVGKYRSFRNEARAERYAKKQLEKFLNWRDKQRAVESEMESA